LITRCFEPDSIDLMKPLAVDERDDDDDDDDIDIISPTPYLLQHCNIDLSATRNLERNNKNATSRISDVNIISKNYAWVIGLYTLLVLLE
jgi:hypothetical protein